MREIKFRAWDKEKKEWIGRTGTTFTSENSEEGVVALSLGGHLRVFSASLMRGEKEEDDLISVGHSEYESVHPCHTEPGYKRQYILCQYTGLKDKNGKEIYEGDLIQFDQYIDDKKIYQVKYDEHYARFLFDWMGTYSELYSEGFYPQAHGKIIGNIYENPELLKEKS